MTLMRPYLNLSTPVCISRLKTFNRVRKFVYFSRSSAADDNLFRKYSGIFSRYSQFSGNEILWVIRSRRNEVVNKQGKINQCWSISWIEIRHEHFDTQWKTFTISLKVQDNFIVLLELSKSIYSAFFLVFAGMEKKRNFSGASNLSVWGKMK